jgi:hypothetical protein
MVRIQPLRGVRTVTLSSGVLAVMALGSLVFVPFTEQYARQSAPQHEWEKSAFRSTNRVLTLMWGLVLALLRFWDSSRPRRRRPATGPTGWYRSW